MQTFLAGAMLSTANRTGECMRLTISICALAVILCAAAPADPAATPAAANDLQSKEVNDVSQGWFTYGALLKAEQVQDPTAKGGAAVRITLSGKGANPWDAGASAPVVKPVSKGDVLLLAFWAKTAQPPAGGDGADIQALIEVSAAPYTPLSPYAQIHIGDAWKLYYVIGTATQDYAPQTLTAQLQMATGAQVIDLGSVFIFDFGPNYDVSKLPHN